MYVDYCVTTDSVAVSPFLEDAKRLRLETFSLFGTESLFKKPAMNLAPRQRIQSILSHYVSLIC